MRYYPGIDSALDFDIKPLHECRSKADLRLLPAAECRNT